MLGVQVLSSPDAVRLLSAEWDALCDASGGATPFQRPAWAVAWMDRMGVSEPRVVALRCGGDLVGLLPAFAWGSPSPRTISLLGAGVSDHLDALAAPGFDDAVRDAIRGWLDGTRDRWDVCAFDELARGALLRPLRAPDGVRAVAEAQSVCPVLKIREETEDVERVVPRAQAAKLRKARRRLERLGGVALQRADRGDFRGALRTLQDLHSRRWARRGAPGVLGDERVMALHDDAAAAFARRGALRLYVLVVAGRPGAVVYGFREARRLHLYMQGIDPSFERESPGLVAVGMAIADALREGVGEVDFLRGGEPYKYDWGAEDEPNERLTLVRAG